MAKHGGLDIIRCIDIDATDEMSEFARLRTQMGALCVDCFADKMVHGMAPPQMRDHSSMGITPGIMAHLKCEIITTLASLMGSASGVNEAYGQ